MQEAAGFAASGVQGQNPWWGGQGAKPHPEAERNLANTWANFPGILILGLFSQFQNFTSHLHVCAKDLSIGTLGFLEL